MQTKIDNNKIKIELVTFDNLKEHARGKTKNVLENFTLFVREENKIKQDGESEPIEFKKSVSLDQKIKDFFSYFIAKKTEETSDGKLSLENKRDLKSEIDIRADSPDKKKIKSSKKETFSTPRKSRKKIMPLIIVLLFLIAGIVLLSFSDNNLSNVNNFISGTIEKGKNVLGIGNNVSENENELYGLPLEQEELNEPMETQEPQELNESIETQEPLIEEEQVVEEKASVDYSSLSTQQLLGSGQIMEINLFAKDLAGGGKNFFQKIWQRIFRVQDDKQNEVVVTGESIYSYLEQNLNLFSENEIYFLNIYEEDRLLTLDELITTFGFKLMPSREVELKEQLATHKLLIYFEPKDAKVDSQIRLGMLFISKEEANLSLEFFKSWEATMVNDLDSLYPENNQKFLKNDKLFSDSTISEQRRYINFTSDQLLSLDYAVAKDGVIIVTSKKFGTAVLELLLSNNEAKGDSDINSSEILESKSNESNETREDIPQ